MGAIHGTHVVRLSTRTIPGLCALVLALAMPACVGTAPVQQGPVRAQRRLPPPLPDPGGWGMHVLALATDPRGGLWAGTFGQGIYVLRSGTNVWEHIAARSGVSSSIASGFVNSFAFTRDGTIWYGTVGGGFGRSTDGGRSWRNWTSAELGPQWQYVAHNGMRSRGDTVYIATADGLRISGDAGASWRCVIAARPVSGGGDRADDGCSQRIEGLPTEYLLSLDVGGDGRIWAGHLQGLSVSKDGGGSWQSVGPAEGVPAARIRAVAVTPDSMIWVSSETDVVVDSLDKGKFVEATVKLPGWTRLPGRVRSIVPTPSVAEPSLVLSFGLAAGNGLGDFRVYYVAAGDNYKPASDIWSMAWTGPPLWPVGGSAYGLQTVLAGRGPDINFLDVLDASAPADARHPRFARPIADTAANPYIDATYRYGSTMGGNFQQHMGIEFNNPAGTPVHAVSEGQVVYAGPAEAGSNTIAILHDTQVNGRFVYSAYYHNRSIAVQVGQRVRTGQVIAEVGNTGRATNDHLHLEIHESVVNDSAAIVNPDERFPPNAVNPELWIEPRPGTGTVAGRVLDAAGQSVPGVRVYGLIQAYPAETPFSFVETYGDHGHSDPSYNENFAVTDIPAGTYLLGVDIGEKRVWRRARVEAGKVTFVEFRP